jgi:hypothetical protein
MKKKKDQNNVKLTALKSKKALVLRFIFDLVFVGAIYVSIAVLSLPWVALLLVIASKWRIFMARPNFWKDNILISLQCRKN